jgi:hypothetical protein
MRASPYDLSALGRRPVAVETPGGRAEYVRQQAAFAERAVPPRARLIEVAARVAGPVAAAGRVTG